MSRQVRKLLCVAVTVAVLIGTCSALAEGETQNTIGFSETTVLGRVDSIDGNAITLNLGSLQSGGMERAMAPGGAGTPPADNNGAAEDQNPQAVPTDDQNGGSIPSDMPDIGSSTFFTATDTLATLVINDESAIVIGESAAAGTIADMSAGSYLGIAIDNTGAITSITILEGITEMPTPVSTPPEM